MVHLHHWNPFRNRTRKIEHPSCILFRRICCLLAPLTRPLKFLRKQIFGIRTLHWLNGNVYEQRKWQGLIKLSASVNICRNTRGFSLVKSLRSFVSIDNPFCSSFSKSFLIFDSLFDSRVSVFLLSLFINTSSLFDVIVDVSLDISIHLLNLFKSFDLFLLLSSSFLISLFLLVF